MVVKCKYCGKELSSDKDLKLIINTEYGECHSCQSILTDMILDKRVETTPDFIAEEIEVMSNFKFHFIRESLTYKGVIEKAEDFSLKDSEYCSFKQTYSSPITSITKSKMFVIARIEGKLRIIINP